MPAVQSGNGSSVLPPVTQPAHPTGPSQRATSPRPSRRSSRVVQPTHKSRGQRAYSAFLVLIWLGVAGTTLFVGFEYYTTPLQERAYSELHDLLKPSGTIGLGYGILGSALMTAGVLVYTLRRRLSLFRRVGQLRYWLEFHIFLCTLGPYFVVLHSSFKFGGFVSIAVWCMVAVVVSGIFGRYVYARIPKTINGQFASLRVIEGQKEGLLQAITQRAGLRAPDLDRIVTVSHRRAPKGFVHALLLAIRFDLTKRSQRRKVRRLLTTRKVAVGVRDRIMELIDAQFQLEQQIVLLKPFQRLFGYWHILHLPLAIVMFIVMIAHILVAVAFGYAWVN